MTARWLAVRVDFIIGVFIAVLALSSIPLASSECGRTCEAHHVRHRFMAHFLSVRMPYVQYVLQKEYYSDSKLVAEACLQILSTHNIHIRCTHH